MNLSISNSKKYPKAFMIALLLFFMTVGGAALVLILTDNMPAPMLSNSFSLDEKFRFIRLNKRYEADYVVLGSSTGLNNIPSEIMMNYPKINQSYLNYSAWGLNITAMSYYWHFIKEIARPKVLIIPINLWAFNDLDEIPEFNQKDVKRYLDGANPFWYYLKYHKNGFMERMRLVIRHRRMNDTQATTKFDRGGGTPLNVTKESQITRRMWKKSGYTKKSFSEEAYESLDKWLMSLRQDGIIAVIVQSPLREHYKESESEFGFMKDHWDRVDAITKQNGSYFFNMQDLLPEDASLFSDSAHLNWWSAEEYVRKLLERMEIEGVFKKVNEGIDLEAEGRRASYD